MTRFTDIDLARLPQPQAVQELDYAARLAARMADLVQRLNDAGIAYNVDVLESDPLKKVEEHAAYYELILLARINDAVRAVLLSSSLGTDLDQVSADLGVERLILTPAADTADGVAVLEDDDALRRRRQLAVEALSVAGPEGAYLFHALSATAVSGNDAVSIVKDAGVYGPSSARETSPGVSALIGVSPGHVHVPIINRTGDGAASMADIAAVQEKLSAREVRPLADYLTVSAAAILPYQINATLRVGPGADTAMIKSLAATRLANYAARQHRVGAVAAQSAIYSAAHVTDDSGVPVVEQVVLNAPLNDVDPGAYGAPYCTGITVIIEVVNV